MIKNELDIVGEVRLKPLLPSPSRAKGKSFLSTPTLVFPVKGIFYWCR